MAEMKIGVVLHGITGRMGDVAHRALKEIARRGGVRVEGDAIVPVPIGVGRDQTKLAAYAQQNALADYATSPAEAMDRARALCKDFQVYHNSVTTGARLTTTLAVLSELDAATTGVFCEKPIALTLGDADRMIAAARENDIVLSYSFQGQFREATHRVRELIASDEIGRPIMARSISGAEIRPKTAMHDRLRGNGGPIVDSFCHTVTAWRCWFQSEPVRVRASGMTLAKRAEELASIEALAIDTATVIVDFASGDVGMHSTSWGLPKGVRTGGVSDLIGPKGVMTPGRDSIRVVKEGGEETVIDGLARDEDPSQVRHFAACVRGEAEPVNTGEDARIALNVSLAALESIETAEQ